MDVIDKSVVRAGFEAYHRGDYAADCPFANSRHRRLWMRGWLAGNRSGMFKHDYTVVSVKPTSFLRFDFEWK